MHALRSTFRCKRGIEGLLVSLHTPPRALPPPTPHTRQQTKRLGGGFGGKETRGIFIHCAAAVPAYHLRRPVRLTLDRDEDMQMTGGWVGSGWALYLLISAQRTTCFWCSVSGPACAATMRNSVVRPLLNAEYTQIS